MEIALAALGASIVGSCLYLDKRIALIILICLSCVGGCSYLNQKAGLSDNHFLEELLEEKIEEELGLDIDLSDTPED